MFRGRGRLKPLNKDGFRSRFESAVALSLKAQGHSFEYEKHRIKYTKPVVTQSYLPDFYLVESGIFVEAKGYFTSKDRVKLLAVRESNPGVDIRLLFQRAKNKLNKNSKTTYGDWADKHGFKWAEGTIPKAWLEERKNH